MQAPILIVGSGMAAWSLVREFRKLDNDTPMLMVTLENGDYYVKPALSNALSQGRSPAALVSMPANAMASSLNLALMPYTRAHAIDVQAKTLHVGEGANGRALNYRTLVLASGARPIRLAIDGNAAGRLKAVNSLADFAALHAALGDTTRQPPRTIAILGAGLIGCEFANDLAALGQQVHVVDPAPRPLAALLPEDASALLQSTLGELGVRWHMGASVVSMAHGAGLHDAVLTLSNGERINADLVLSAVGLRADTALAQTAGLVCGRAIEVDSFLQTSAPDIYALGDCVQYGSAGGRCLPFVQPIMQASRALAATLAGVPTALRFPAMPVQVKTPALPLVLLTPPAGQAGQWHADDATGAWRFLDETGCQHGFVLAGQHTTRRAALLLQNGRAA